MDSNVVTSTESLSPSPTKPKKYKWIITGLVICAGLLMAATGLLGMKVGRSVKEVSALRGELESAQETIDRLKQQEESVCYTKECVISAATLLENIDTSIDPCQDFYQFACGGWLRRNRIPETSSRWNQFNILREQLTEILKDILTEPSTFQDSKPVNDTRIMYKACMDTERIESMGLSPLTRMLDLYGRWPMTVSDWRADQFDWKSISASITRDFGVSFLFSVTNYIDWKDTNKSSLYVDQSGLGLPYSTLINAKSNSTAQVMKAYATYVLEAAKAVRDAIDGGSNDSAIILEVDQMINFQIELAKIQTKPEERRNRTRMYNSMSINDLQRLTNDVNTTNPFSHINWIDYINDIYSVVNISVSKNEKIIAIEPEFIRQFVRLLDQTPPRVIANYIHWRLVTMTSDNTNQLMNEAAFKFFKIFYGTSNPSPRWRGCVNKVANSLGFAVSASYIERAFDEQAKKETVEMIGHLKDAFSTLVKEAQWMDEETKARALEKAAAMKEFIAYPEWIRNKTELTKFYKGIELTRKGHFENFLNIYRFFNHQDLKGLRLPTDRETWVTFPSVVNAFYHSIFNSITFPAGILQPPFFGKGRLAALNYGSIGAVIGHEITHGFDDQGRQTDKDGLFNLWWTNSTLNQYLKGAQCFVEQYGNFTFPQFAGTDAYRINGIISQGENIADNGGVREAFLAYQNYVRANGQEDRLPGLEKYTPEQLFFLSYANIWCGKEKEASLKQQILNGPHSPGRYRVLGTLSNSIDFSRHFNCPVNSTMNRSSKCILW